MWAGVYALDLPIWKIDENFERVCEKLKSLEGYIVKCYIANEVVEFCSECIANAETIGVPKPRDNGSKDVGVGNPKLMVCDDFE